MEEDSYSHLARKSEVTVAIVDGRDVVAVCGAKGDPKTFEGEMQHSLPLCPKCEEIVEHGRRSSN